MRKKGLGWGTFISLIFGVIVVSVIIFAIAFPGQLGSKTRDVSFSFGLGELPSERPPEFGGTPYVSKELKDYFDGLIAKIEAFETEEHCLIPLDQMPSLGRFSIHLTAVDGSDNGKISLVKEGQGGFVVTESNEFNFNFYPCVVAWEGAENLYNNRLADNINPLLQTPEYHNVLEAMNMILTSRTKIITQEASDNEYTISDNDGRRYLYKADASHYCFTSIQSGGSCSLKRDDDSNPESLEEGCLDSMPFFVGTCDGSSVAVNRFRSTCNRVCNSVEHQECIIGIDDGDNDNNLRACYQSFRFEGHDDYCVCGDTSEKIFPPAVPPPGLVESTCDFECGSAECIMGIDDYNKPRRCDKTFTFGDNPDIEVDYCFCGGDSRNHFPTLSGADEDHRCMDADMCGSRSNCIVGMDDEDAGDGDKRRCNEPFTFEHDDIPLDDYCICSNPPEKVIPIPT